MQKRFEKDTKKGKEKTKNDSFQQIMKEKWEGYNQGPDGKVGNKENGRTYFVKSYTHLFFKKFHLQSHLDDECKKILQFGASHGQFLEKYKNTWDTMGYDFSENAIESLTEKNIPCRQLDLNNIALTQTYLNQDMNDSPSNFIAIRVFQYIDEQALIALIYTLLNNATANSRYIIANSIGSERDYQTLVKNYISSFFGARTDMKFLLTAQTPEKLDEIPDHEHHDDEVIVVKKL